MKRKCRDFGALLVDKPRGPSSHEIVQWVRWSLGTSSVGHCGTLDPDASGLMVLVVGKATRLASRLSVQDKGYDAIFALGASTDTDDSQGQVCQVAAVKPEQIDAAQEILDGAWVGAHELPPPAYSAVRVDGIRAHRAARKGAALELEPRPMRVLASKHCPIDEASRAQLQLRDDLVADCEWVASRIDVSKGSYIRSLAVELGRRIKAPTHLASLRRYRCAHISLEDQRVLRGLDAQPWTPAPNGAPRWRIRCGPGEKAQQAQLIRSALVDPFALLELPILSAQDHPDFAEHLAPRVLHGQAVPLEVTAPHLDPATRSWVWMDHQAGQAAILGRDPKAETERWAPELVLRWPVSCESSKNLPMEASKA